MKNITNSKICLKCKGCCIFDNKDNYLAPFITIKEARFINKKYIVKRNKFLQLKLSKASGNIDCLTCPFLDKKNQKCKIYKNRPLECSLWPFVIGWDKSRKDIYLWVVNSRWCPAVDISQIKKNNTIGHIINCLQKKKVFKEIKNGERYVWPYQKYQIKLKRITNLMK